jgi:hypothetical protein
MSKDSHHQAISQVKYDLTPEVCEMDTIRFSSYNVIPHQWYQNIRLESGNADLVSITLLSDIVFWYRSTEVRDESTGLTVEIKKKFRADALQKSKQQLALQFGFTERQVKESLSRLEQLGVITREFRTVQTGEILVGNVMFIHIHPEKIFEISQIISLTPMTLKRHRYDVKTSDTYNTSYPSSESLTEKVIVAQESLPEEKTPAAGNNNFSAKKKEKKVYTCLQELDIPETTKKSITSKHTEQEVQYVAQLFTHKDSPYKDKPKAETAKIIQHALKDLGSYKDTIDNLGQPKLTKQQREAKECEIARSDNDARKEVNRKWCKSPECPLKDRQVVNGYKIYIRDDSISFEEGRTVIGSVHYIEKNFLTKLRGILKQLGIDIPIV